MKTAKEKNAIVIAFPVLTSARIAKRMTSEAAAMRNWRMTNKRNRAMREVAREWMNGRGYTIATVKDLYEKYGNLSHYDTTAPGADKLIIWGIDWNSVRKVLEFVPIR